MKVLEVYITEYYGLRNFLANIIKANEQQYLEVKGENGNVLNSNDLLSMNDVLVVLSADGQILLDTY